MTSSFDWSGFISPDGPGGFLHETRIKCPDGDGRAIEHLKRGEYVLDSDNRARQVVWVGKLELSISEAQRLGLLPIRILKDAIDHAVPSRDLQVSPYHAILIDNVLVQAGALVNNLSIIRPTDVDAVFTYHNLELDDHAVILAEDTPAETFVDNVRREIFDNEAEHRSLFPNGKPVAEMPYPRARSHRQVSRQIRTLIAARAEMLTQPRRSCSS